MLSRPVLKELVLKQAAPAALGQAIEEWQLQTIALFAAHVGSTQLAAHDALLSLFFFLSSGMYGLLNATSIRIGVALGAKDIRTAKLMVKVDGLFSAGVALCIGVALLVAQHELGKLFSSDPEVIAAAAAVAPFMGAGYLFISLFYVAIATLRGTGKPGMVAVAFVIGAWVVGVPTAAGFAFGAGWGLRGLWIGLNAGYVTVTGIAWAAVLRIDWDAACAAAAERTAAAMAHARQVLHDLPIDLQGEEVGVELLATAGEVDMAPVMPGGGGGGGGGSG